ncbi:hypothetical protein SELSPUOL_01410 [Selenomonas sputigena ATCC 35185]|uniref:Uncharacterized protein n=1 Tax=Selenomonas sputigena (strain ATCC 35185 / DSM 20758 / CCUG 44933 / VPI D19B-28) TaxID=546271 RepID=C9LVB7_SELS3|nr:hypothetical protein SELSPUOL_01410 [Selenomonas sputigena ATCC 35185]
MTVKTTRTNVHFVDIVRRPYMKEPISLRLRLDFLDFHGKFVASSRKC